MFLNCNFILIQNLKFQYILNNILILYFKEIMRELKVDLIRTMDERDRRDSLIVKLDKEATNLRSLAEIYENDMKLLHDKIDRSSTLYFPG